ncbi:hypothetical protein JHD50_09610 [Sulfurimonas sp. MAG313]|nr:plastocyanin/azurin family copper-binding protein [Sulfurimonas sp. MAG313]MDF1881554.1 hypothetical protein [Sulfurimonas sp. MAG313]
MIKIFVAIALLGMSVMAKDHVIEQKDKEFKPHTIKVKVGDTITFKNHDGFAHNAFSDDEANEFDIGMQKPNQDITITMSAKSTVEVECAIHPNMVLTIEVE